MAVALLAGLAAGLGVGILSDSGSFGFAVGAWVVAGAAAAYALFALRMHDIAGWALKRAFASLGLLFPLATRALPMLLIFVTFLFINTEVWQVTSAMKGRRHLGGRAVLRPGGDRLPGGAAGRGARPVRRRHLGRDLPRRHRRHALGADGAPARRRGHRPPGRGRGHGPAEGEPGARPARGPGGAGAAARVRGLLLLRAASGSSRSRTRSSRAGSARATPPTRGDPW